MFSVIEVKNVSKYYRIYRKPLDKLVELLTGRSRASIKKALEKVSFEVFKGEAFGIIGENGAGKSTLLSIIAGINKPTLGEVVIRGEVASILELGTGFHPELTGTENIFLYGSLMGFPPDHIKKKLDFIKNFSELDEYLDRPLKTYSTGMVMRLAFSTMLALEPDIFIIDEALSVGDLYFQKKVFNKMREFKEKGGTILFTSHSMYQITNLCERALWLKDGQVVMIGNSLDVAKEYENYIREKESSSNVTNDNNVHSKNEVHNSSPVWVENIYVNKNELKPGDNLIVNIVLRSKNKIKVHVGILFRRNDNENIALYTTKHENIDFEIDGEELISFVFEDFPLLYGKYYMDIYVTDEYGNVFYDVKTQNISVIKTSFLDIGVFKIRGQISIGVPSK